MSMRRSRQRFGALAGRGLLAGLLLPGLLLLNLLCLCTHAAGAQVVTKSAEAGPCRAHAESAAVDTGRADTPEPQHEGAACPHCGDGSALFASPRVVSDFVSPGAVAAPVAPVALTLAFETAIPRPDPAHAPPRPLPRNPILRI